MLSNGSLVLKLDSALGSSRGNNVCAALEALCGIKFGPSDSLSCSENQPTVGVPLDAILLPALPLPGRHEHLSLGKATLAHHHVDRLAGQCPASSHAHLAAAWQLELALAITFEVFLSSGPSPFPTLFPLVTCESTIVLLRYRPSLAFNGFRGQQAHFHNRRVLHPSMPSRVSEAHAATATAS